VNSSAGLAGVVAGQSAIATVGQAGKGLNYRGYSIDDLAASATFEEVAYLLLYGQLPTRPQLTTYTSKLQGLRTLPDTLKTVLKLIPKDTHPMDVLRTGCSMLGTIEPEHDFSEQYDIADRLLALFPGMLCYWYAFHYEGKEIDEHSDEDTIGGHFLALLHGKNPSPLPSDAAINLR
jgi:2-methylcitrate synthase